MKSTFLVKMMLLKASLACVIVKEGDTLTLSYLFHIWDNEQFIWQKDNESYCTCSVHDCIFDPLITWVTADIYSNDKGMTTILEVPDVTRHPPRNSQGIWRVFIHNQILYSCDVKIYAAITETEYRFEAAQSKTLVTFGAVMFPEGMCSLKNPNVQPAFNNRAIIINSITYYKFQCSFYLAKNDTTFDMEVYPNLFNNATDKNYGIHTKLILPVETKNKKQEEFYYHTTIIVSVILAVTGTVLAVIVFQYVRLRCKSGSYKVR
ncbi:uncharacterized protein LOC131941467 [Physella acuta]|uniref:uncharacterized protein LOC131941467 n=1 Tax=Physella acuta TaxID=109671 RepID=UPI0027DD6578|nr:uncharacterized protein LOC131941467 [Physella acuta]